MSSSDRAQQQPPTNKTPVEDSQVSDHPPATASAKPNTMDAAHPQYMLPYAGQPVPHYHRPAASPTSYGPPPYGPNAPHWQPQQYNQADTGLYYGPGEMVAPQPRQQPGGAHPSAAEYARWASLPASPVPANLQTNPMMTGYYSPPQLSPTTANYPGGVPSKPLALSEAGPSRTARAARRRSTQDPLGMKIVQEGVIESPEASPTIATASAKRVRGGANKLSSPVATSFAGAPGVSVSGGGNAEGKSFPCNACSATFTRKGDCLRHQRSVHTRETPYDCQGCGERFSRSDMRGKHWKADPSCESAHWREVCRAMGKEGLVEGQ